MGVLVKIGLAQINATVGDFAGNSDKILSVYGDLAAAGADIVIFPELCISGYPPQDLLFHSGFVERGERVLEELQAALREAAMVVGFVENNSSSSGHAFFNSAAILEPGKPRRSVRKTLLPTYDVFDEARYFEPGPGNEPVLVRGCRVGVTICEDIWTAEHLPRRLYAHSPLDGLMHAGVDFLLNLSASPFQIGKPAHRTSMLAKIAAHHHVPLAYCNAVGGNDQLVFDGNSLAVGPDGRMCQLAGFREDSCIVDMHNLPGGAPVPRDDLADLHAALTLGLKDYMRKCGFTSCVLGLSGGIDSAVTAALAVDAIGAKNVLGVLMPTDFSSRGSIEDARALATNLDIPTHTIPIQPAFDGIKDSLKDVFTGLPEDTTEENIQARLRGLTLMALSNKLGSLLLTTGNKSELAVGYCTLYGDMCGGLAILSDVPKTLVYQLAHWMNQHGRPRIPDASITKPPSAELRPNQCDQDSLPPYDSLDAILALAIEDGLNIDEISARGFDRETVQWIVGRVTANEYKRAQAAPGIKVTGRAFGIGRRIPIAQKFRG
jgi:NAD+ synthase (glutamine-hydrolysing)